ncbi:MAG: cytochrome b/b6 domain-containing protein, partial [Pseudomonadota bacterium]
MGERHDGVSVPERAQYTAIARFLHWVIAVGIFAMLVMGIVMTNVPLADDVRFVTYQIHKSIGLILLAAVVLRLAWRFIAPPPPLPAGMSPTERFG